MGLDNFPKQYPCKTQGTAVMVQRTNREGTLLTNEDGTPDMAISCEATQACGGCPYMNERNKQTDLGNPVYGMFGTDCWYRGKYGNFIIGALGIENDELSFYGDNEDGTEKSPESCLQLADAIGEELDDLGGHIIADGEDITPDLRYAEWYLRWAAEFCDGLEAWY